MSNRTSISIRAHQAAFRPLDSSDRYKFAAEDWVAEVGTPELAAALGNARVPSQSAWDELRLSMDAWILERMRR